MPTARQIKDQRTYFRAALERDRRKRDRAKLRELGLHVKHARTAKTARAREVRISCRQARTRLRAAKRAARATYLHSVAAATERERLASRTKCDGAKARARARGEDGVRRAAAALAAERAHQAQARVWSRPSPLARKAAKRSIERIHESASEVEANLPADLVPVWRAVQSKIKSTPRLSRTEAFLEWAHGHSAQVVRIQDRASDREAEQMFRNQAALRKAVASPSTYRRMTDDELRSDVPF